MTQNFNDAEHVLALMRELHAFSEFGEERAINALKNIDEDRLFAIFEELLENRRKSIPLISRTMQRINMDRSVDYLIHLSNDQDTNIRHRVCGLMSNCEQLSLLTLGQVSDALIVRLGDVDSNVRHVAVFALGKVGLNKAVEFLEYVANFDFGTDFEGRSIRDLARLAIDQISQRHQN
ncbi:MAG: HEAT repeat domain-containing protein [Chloroflexota bacterium]